MKGDMKRLVKKGIPWRLRYFIKLQEAKGNIRLPDRLKQQRSMEEYNEALYSVLRVLGIKDFEGKAVCELGSGQYFSHAFLEYQLGAVKEFLLEIADFANVHAAVSMDGLILDCDYPALRKLPGLSKGETWNSYLNKIHAVYNINGLDGYRTVPDDSVDYVFSFAVLEHIRKQVFADTLKETYRFMRQGAVAFHTVDFTDHLGGGKNHLRYPASVWEDEIHYNMDNYTNRISCSQMKDVFEKIGFKVLKLKTARLKRNPLKRARLAAEFRELSKSDFMTSSAVFILKKL